MPVMLIAEDNPQILKILTDYANKENFRVHPAKDGVEAWELFESHSFDVILLDVCMPQMDGFTLCRKIRSQSTVPIIMVTAKGEDYERIMGLDIGADDYIVKPFSPGEVMARVRAVLRRIQKPEAANEVQTLLLDNLEINLEDFQVKIDGEIIPLTKKETEILWTLASTPNKVFSRENLLNSLWGFDYFGDSRTVDSHIKRLRAKLDAITHPSWEVKTIWGMGYKLEVKDS